MRVVAGTARGRRLVAPRGRSTRPTSDRVREAVFSSLAGLGLVEGANVLDLFAGSGALGIEALSRGAASATFVDDREDALAIVRANLAATGLSGQVRQRDALAFLRDPKSGSFDLAFADPPYSFDGWGELLARLDAAAAVLESDRALDVGPEWEVVRQKHYGSTVVTLARTVRDRQ